MSDDIRTESWCGHDIRFIDINGEWYALLKDICDALKLQIKDVSHRLDPDMLKKVPVEITRKNMRPLSYKTKINDLFHLKKIKLKRRNNNESFCYY